MVDHEEVRELTEKARGEFEGGNYDSCLQALQKVRDKLELRALCGRGEAWHMHITEHIECVHSRSSACRDTYTHTYIHTTWAHKSYTYINMHVRVHAHLPTFRYVQAPII